MKFDPNLEEFINKYYKDSYTIDKISEEGSNRSYYRISSNTKSMVLCITYPFLKDHDDFIVLTEYLIKKNAKIPKMIDLYQEKGWILLEDGGNYYLQDIIKNFDKNHIIKIYRSIIDELIYWHSFSDIPPNVKNRFFDLDKFQFEIDFCVDKIKKNHLPLPPFEFEVFLKEAIEFLCEQKEYVFTHRDFHSRNILFYSEKSDFKIIDYQDARMGLRWYDLSSLLFDPYVKLNSDIILKLFDYYYESSSLPKKQKHFYLNLFYLQALQRLFKALGSFLYLGYDLNKKHFLNYIIPDLEQMILLSQLGRFPDTVYLYSNQLLNHFRSLRTTHEN